MNLISAVVAGKFAVLQEFAGPRPALRLFVCRLLHINRSMTVPYGLNWR